MTNYHTRRANLLAEYYRLVGKGNMKSASLLLLDLFLLLGQRMDAIESLADPGRPAPAPPQPQTLWPESNGHDDRQMDLFVPMQLANSDTLSKPKVVRRPRSPNGTRRPRLRPEER